MQTPKEELNEQHSCEQLAQNAPLTSHCASRKSYVPHLLATSLALCRCRHLALSASDSRSLSLSLYLSHNKVSKSLTSLCVWPLCLSLSQNALIWLSLSLSLAHSLSPSLFILESILLHLTILPFFHSTAFLSTFVSMSVFFWGLVLSLSLSLSLLLSISICPQSVVSLTGHPTES